VDPESLATPFIQSGLLGTALVGTIIALVVVVRREWKRSDRIEATREAEAKVTQEQLVPSLVRAADALARQNELTEQNIAALSKNAELMRELRERRPT
jgi:hypothetical protein